ncbi:protein NSP-INTERACTING KINASE 2-like isoform X1 [Brassica napus]|uniref:protein NSP-INTERACTING KINASE 2-like isoform X1 n=1 Tax=Brassica napus TaxID=3708 RepID=UPI0006AB66E0|nr:protein NSP-INTERACTING KINASE 2-like isoform X1 [Brassica napus]
MVLRKKEKSYALFSSILFCIVFLFLSPAELTYVFNYEEIKSSLTDPHGVLMDWNMAAADPCSWNLITCSPDNFVPSIEAANQNFSGTLLAPSIGNLTYLETVLLQNNYITGNIPPEIGKLMKLKTLDLSNNNFSGQLPSTLSHSKSFQYLKLNNNSLTGTIPTSVANMTQLILLDLSYSNLSGPVPTLHANTFNVMGNPQICSTGTEEECNETHPKPKSLIFSSSDPSDGGTINQKFAVQFGLSLACICLLIDHSLALVFI